MSQLANIFRRQPAKPKGFDRTARDQLKRRPQLVLSGDSGGMLVGDSRGPHVVIDTQTMRVMRLTRFGRWVDTSRRVSLPLGR